LTGVRVSADAGRPRAARDWALAWDGEQPRATFPGARYLVQRADWEAFAALGDEDQAAFDQAVRPLADLGGLELVSGPTMIPGRPTAPGGRCSTGSRPRA